MDYMTFFFHGLCGISELHRFDWLHITRSKGCAKIMPNNAAGRDNNI